MPGNELEERVHNFFAQDNSLQGQPHSQAVEGNWPVLNGNFWVGSQRQVDLLNPNNLNYTSENSDIDRGEGNKPLRAPHVLNLTQSNVRPDFARSQCLNEQPNLNGFMHENQFHQTRQNEANFLAMNRASDQSHFITSKGLSFHELQQGSGPDHPPKSSDRLGTSGSSFSFDLFGGQQQISHQQSGTPQALQHQQSGTNNMQQLQQQQQLMIRKMQELQRQQQIQQLDLRQHNLINEVTPFAKQTSGGQSTLVNCSPNSDTSQHPWAAERGTSWLNRGSPVMHGSPSGHGFQTNLGQAQRVTDLVPRQVDQSLYGVPISSSRGLPVNQYSQMATARSSVPQMPTSSNYFQGNQHNSLPDQVGVQNEYSISRHKFQNGNMFGLASGQSLNPGMTNMGGLEQANSMSRNARQQDFLGRQELAVQPETSHEKPSMQVASSQNEVALDPAEEKILFGSDDNIWAAFGKVSQMSDVAGNSFDNGDLLNSLPSIQSGSWSALMQSAVSEASGNDVAPQEEWSGLVHHNNDGPSGNQPPSNYNNSCKQEAYLANDKFQLPSALSSGSFPPDDNISTTSVMGFNQLGQKFQNEPNQTLQAEMSERFFLSPEDSGNRSKFSHPLQEDLGAKTNSPTWMPGQTGTRLPSNDWNAVTAVQRGDRVTSSHEVERSHQNSENSQVRGSQGVIRGSSLWMSNSVPSSDIELVPENSRVSNHQENQGILSLNNASEAKSCKAQANGESNSFAQNNYLLNRWKNAYTPATSQDGGSLGRLLHQTNEQNRVIDSTSSHEKGEVPRNEMQNFDVRESSNDSHRSNLSQRTSGGFPDLSDSQSLLTGKEKSTNQLSRKVSAPRKFQYHPMGNVDEDLEPTYGLKQPTRIQAMSQQNAHFGQSKIFGHVPRDSTEMEKGQSSEFHRDTKGTYEDPSRENLSGHAPNIPVHFSQPIDAHASENASSSSQNMLELLHKVDQSRNHGDMMQFSSAECKSSSQRSETENFDGFGYLQQPQSSVPQGFGLQLGPPSQKLRTSDHQFSSQHGQGIYNSLYSSTAAAVMGDKGQQMVASHSVQSLPTAEETQVEFRLSRPTTPRHGGNENSFQKTSGNSKSAFHSGTPHSRGNVQNQQLTRVSGQMSMKQHIDSLNGNASYSAQKISAETLFPDASGSFQQENHVTTGGMYRQSGPNDVRERVPTVSTPRAHQEQTIGQPGDSPQILHNMWTNVQHNSGFSSQQVSSRIPESAQPNIVESSSAPLMQGFVNSQRVLDGEEQRSRKSSGQPLASLNTNRVPKIKNSFGKTSSVDNCSDDSPANSASTEKDMEAFGRSLKPNSYSHQNYSLQNQLEALKDGEIDSSDRASKRMRGPDNFVGAHQAAQEEQRIEYNAVVGYSLASDSGVPIQDNKILGFSRPPDVLLRNSSQPGNIPSHDSLELSKNVSQSFSSCDYMASVGVDRPQVSHQMAPSWFSQHGTYKNGQMLQIHDSHKVTSLRPGESPFAPGKASSDMSMLNRKEEGSATPVDTCQINDSHQICSSVFDGHFASPQSSHLNVNDQHLVIFQQKKRKSASSEIHPWHKVISEGPQDDWTLSFAVEDWSKAANHLTEKVEDDAELIQDGPPVVRSRRRLVLTTHLMQHLLRIASPDVISSYEIMVYTVSRIALGDACSMASRSNNLGVPCNDMDLLLAKCKSTERNGGRCYTKAIEELMGRATKLENDFLRLDKSASILDSKVEHQDLEKFSIINRFARFHGRGQSDNIETSSADVNSSLQKPLPQRFVTALPMPRTLPDTVQCLSL